MSLFRGKYYSKYDLDDSLDALDLDYYEYTKYGKWKL